MSLVRSHRSNPALKQALGKARFLRKIFFDCGIKSAAVYAAKAKKRNCPAGSGAYIFCKTCG